MLEIKPLRGLHFDKSRVDLSKVIAPPYDVISDPLREELYKRDPNNVVRIEHPKAEREDLTGEEKYARARGSLEDLIQKGILVQDEKPSFYIYEQIFRNPENRKKYSRIGLFCLAKLEDWDKGNIIPHEKTHRSAKEDRFKLLKETRTSTSPIFTLYDDESSLISSLYDDDAGEVVAEFSDEHGERHRLVRISDESQVNQISNLFKDKKMVIADGHHRFETALNYQRHLERLGKKNPADEYAFFCLVEWDEPGLIILPIHRYLKNLSKMGRDEFLLRLKKDFILKEIALQYVPQVVKELERDFVIYLGGNFAYHAMIKDPESITKELPAGKPEIWYDLTVNWIEHYIYQKILNLDERQRERSVSYSASFKTAMTEVTAGLAKVAILISATQKSELKEIAEAHELMPQKSTYFYPKIPTGLVLYTHYEPSISPTRVRRFDRPGDGRKLGLKAGSAPQPEAKAEVKPEKKEEPPQKPKEDKPAEPADVKQEEKAAPSAPSKKKNHEKNETSEAKDAKVAEPVKMSTESKQEQEKEKSQ